MTDLHDDPVGDIADYYDRAEETEGARLDRHQLEHDMTWRYLKRWLPASGTILEVGCATGAYTVDLARLGYRVTAVDLSQVLLEACRRRIIDGGFAERVQFVLADARRLDGLDQSGFDAVLIMGPLYHLVYEADRRKALGEAWKHLREGGVLFSTFISRYGIMGDLIRNVPGWIHDQADLRGVLDRGRDPEDHPTGGFRGYFARPQEIIPLHENLGFQTIALAGVEPGISADDESYNCLEGEERRLWLDALEEISTEPSAIGASRHLLYIGRKP